MKEKRKTTAGARGTYLWRLVGICNEEFVLDHWHTHSAHSSAKASFVALGPFAAKLPDTADSALHLS